MAADLDRVINLGRPRQVDFGLGAASRLADWVTGRGLVRPLIVADAFNAGRIALLGFKDEVRVFSEFHPEPDADDLAALLAAAEASSPDVVIGFGGGSAMDLAKLAAVLPGSGQSLANVVGVDKVIGRRSALVQVPTTAGTGSEAGSRALVTDPASLNKLAVQSDHMLADFAVVDPELTLSVPRAITVATGVDALAHCVEAFTSRKAHRAIDLYALEGARLIGASLPRASADGSDREARAGMALASFYGGLCLGPVNTTAGHAVACPLGTRHHIPHGVANAVIFPHVLAFNAPAAPKRTAAVLTALGLKPSAEPSAVFDATHGWCAKLGCEMRLSALRIPKSDLPVMAREAHAIRRLLDNNPRDLTVEQILAIYREAY
jgi:alcohol dehydrogenase class IV